VFNPSKLWGSLQEPSPLCTAEREQDNEKLEREIAERKAGAVSYEEWLKMKET
jgi:hypothetical protein